MDYIFYDTETTGLKSAFDQIIQFAAIRTNENLEELERFDIRCRLMPHIIPSPEAMLVTGIMPMQLIDPNLPSHFEAFCKIRSKLLSWSPAIIVGYNSLAFDEEFLRQGFFQSLLPTYLTNTNGNQRSDIMRILHAVRIYKPNVVSVPMGPNGKETFRLELIAPSNGYNHENAHEAMADVKATIFMAQFAMDQAPDIWNIMDRATKKNEVLSQITKSHSFVLSERYFNTMHNWLVTFCGIHLKNKNKIAVFDLNFDPDDYLSLSAEQLVEVLDNKSAKVIRTLQLNKLPIIMPADCAPEGTKALDIPEEERKSRINKIVDNEDFTRRVGEALALRDSNYETSSYLEKRIYDGFPSRSDETLMSEFSEANWEHRAIIASKITDGRLAEFAHRLIYFERPDLLPTDKLDSLHSWIQSRVLSENIDVPWMSAKKAFLEIENKFEEASVINKSRLREIRDFIIERVQKTSNLDKY